MRKDVNLLLKISFALLVITMPFFKTSTQVHAQACSASVTPSTLNEADSQQTVTINTSGINPQQIKEIHLVCTSFSAPDLPYSVTPNSNGQITVTLVNHSCGVTLNDCKCWQANGTKAARIDLYGGSGSSNNFLCNTPNFAVINQPVTPFTQCSFTLNPNPPTAGNPYQITVSNLPVSQNLSNLRLELNYYGDAIWHTIANLNSSDSQQTTSISQTEDRGKQIQLAVVGYVNGAYYDIDHPICLTNFQVGDQPAAPNTNPTQPGPAGNAPPVAEPTNICSFSTDPSCDSCVRGNGVPTPFGCINANPQKLIQDLLKLAIGIAGGIAFLMIIFGGFTVMTSSGNPERLNSGKEIIVSAIAGLLLIVFSVVVLKIIGVDILKIPGLS